ncbi:NAD(P)/FAD-dependent oxidoreductase [Segetibacter sp. 3557_3]|uniref:NAD(P)/FAD-dependent oxidoreductase n=1 Tax=Segetibacter sp. 3557_3 TaxID=2547429 RepID=UPI001058FE4D|nr:NAD(P)/FAD-dependent oxidoreductase [Segetibacter sp. 3557_3]TDH18423.1 NAD(P)/FAD-dependent oxidoreductase [Segetibacter sp. 3557_3]
MTTKKNFDVIIIGGSYSGLSAAMALGRALRNVLVIDDGKPCNRQTPHSHNFLTQDGKTPAEISTLAKEQVSHYDTIAFVTALATGGRKSADGFEVDTNGAGTFTAGKLIFATGVKDIMPEIPGFSACWGTSVIHCPYCHGYEVKHQQTGILGNGDYGFEFSKMIRNWTSDLTLFTNGESTLTEEQTAKLQKHNIRIVEHEVERFEHDNGHINSIVFRDGTSTSIKAIYARPAFTQSCDIPQQLGCELTEHGHLKTDMLQKTTVEGVFACGDNTTPFRTVATAVAAGVMAGAACNKEIIEDRF